MNTQKIIKFFKIITCSYSILVSHVYAFNNLEELINYAKQKEELPSIDNNDYLHPNYSSFFNKEIPNFISRNVHKILDYLNIKKELWTPELLKSLLIDITKYREEKNYKGDFIVKITPSKETKVVIWADLRGAFHSLSRTLDELKKQKIINDELKIIAPNCFFIFNGNVVGQSPYNLETLTIILKLMEKNSEKVFVIKGENESKEHWININVKKELSFKAKSLSLNGIPLRSEINSFFQTLPLAIYIKTPPKAESRFIRISNYDRSYQDLDESYFSEFLDKTTETFIQIFNLKDKKYSDKKIEIEAIIKNQDRTFAYRKTDGLEILFPDRGATAWSIFSSPTLSSQKLYQFFNDGFAILTIRSEDYPIIALFKQNSVEKKGFSIKKYNLLTEILLEEKEIEKKVIEKEKEEIRIGTTLDLSAELSHAGKKILSGLHLRINQENKKGGIDGKKINLMHLNDKYDPNLAKKNIENFLEKNIDIILTPLSSHTLQGYLDFIKEKKILTLFPEANSPIFRKQEYSHLIHFIASSNQEAMALTEYLIKDLNVKKIGILWQPDPYSEGAFQGAKKILEKYTLKQNVDWIETSNLPHTTNVEKAIKQIKNFNPEAILILTADVAAQNFIRESEIDFLYNKKIGIIEPSDEFLRLCQTRKLKVDYTDIVPPLTETQIEIVNEYLQAAKEENLEIDSAGLEAYMTASIFIDLLKRIEGDITKEKIIEEAEKIKNYNFKGLTLNFNPQTREIFNTVWLITSDKNILSFQVGEEEIKKEPKKEIEEIEKEIPEKKEEEMRIGTTMDFSSKLLYKSMKILNGLSFRIREENKKGGVNGKKIHLIHLDDKYNPKLAKENIEKFLKQNIDIILTPRGSFTLQGYLDFIENKKILVLFPTANAPIFRKPEYNHLLHLFPSSKQEAMVITEHMIKELNIKKIGIVWQTEPFSEGAFQGAKQILEKYNLEEGKDWIAVSHPPETIEITNVLKKIKDFNPQAILFFSLSRIAEILISQLEKDILLNISIAIIEPDDQFLTFLKKHNLKVTYTDIIPPLSETNIEIVKEYLQFTKNENLKTDSGSFLGYLSASIFIDLLKKIEGNITKEKINEEAEKIKNYNFKGLTLNFNPQTREIFNTVWLTTSDDEVLSFQVKEEKIEEIKKEPEKEIEKVEKEEKEIRIGTTMDLSGELSFSGKEIVSGLHLLIDKENKKDGINDKLIKITHLDDKNDPNLAKKNIKYFLEKNINIILTPLSSYTLQRYLDLIEDEKILVIFPDANADIFRKQKYKNLLHSFISSKQETIVLTEYLINILNIKKIGIVWQTEPFSEGAFQGAKQILEKYNLKEDKDWIAPHFPPGGIIQITNEIEKIKAFNPQIILFLSISKVAEIFLSQVDANFLIDKIIGLIEPNKELLVFLKKRNIKILHANSVPPLTETQIEIVNEYLQAAKEKNLKASPPNLEAYINASIFIDLLKRIKGNITKEKIIEEAEKIKNYNFKGLTLNFNPKTRELLNTIWLTKSDGTILQFQVKEEKIEEIKKEPKKEIEKVEKEVPEKEEKEIRIGTTMDLSEYIFDVGKSILKTLNLRINEENKKGGINGKKIHLIHLDDKFDPQLAKKNMEKLAEMGIDIILTPVSSYTVKGCIPLIKEKKVGVFFPYASAPIFFQPELKNIINLLATSEQEGKTIAKYLLENHPYVKKIVLFYQTEPYNEGIFQGAKEVLDQYNLKEGENWIAVSHLPNEIKFSDGIKKIKKFEPQAFFLFSSTIPTKHLLNQLGQAFLYNKLFIGCSAYSPEDFVKFMERKKLNFSYYLPFPFPDPKTCEIELIKEYIEQATQKNYKISSLDSEIYITCSIFLDILKKIKGKITKEKIIEQMEKIKNYHYKGIYLNFNPQTRSLATRGYIHTPNEKSIEYIFEKAIKKDLKTIEEEVIDKKELKKEGEITEKEKKEIVIGTTMDLSKEMSENGKELLKGLLIRIREENKRTGINGKKVKLIYLDDEYDPKKARENIETLLKRGINIILSPLGSYPFLGYLSLVKEKKIIAISPGSSPIFRKPDLKNVVHFFASPKPEGKALARYSIEELHKNKIALLYQSEPFSEAALQGAIEILKKYNLKEETDWIKTSHLPHTIDIQDAATKIKKFNPNSIILLSIAAPAQALIKKLGSEFLFDKSILVIDAVDIAEFKTLMKKKKLKFVSAQTVPNPETSKLKIVEEYRQAIKAINESPDVCSLEGYFTAAIFFDIVRKIKGEITKEKIIKEMEKIKNYDFKGDFTLNFNPATRELANYIWINTLEGESFLYKDLDEKKVETEEFKEKEMPPEVEQPPPQIPIEIPTT